MVLRIIQIEVELNEVLSFFKIVLENLPSITIPYNWTFDISRYEQKQVISFYKLCTYGANYSRSIEKQLVIAEGNVYFFISFFNVYPSNNYFTL